MKGQDPERKSTRKDIEEDLEANGDGDHGRFQVVDDHLSGISA